MSDNILKIIKPADIITLINALLGFTAIIMILKGSIDNALILIFAAVIADAADGAIARHSGYGILGANLDSLADVISFGVAPAAVAYVILGNEEGLISGLFLVCGILRLARFNVAGKKDGFQGVPITAGGFVVALFLMMRDHVPYFSQAFIFLLIILSLLMVSTISYPKLKNPLILAPMAIFLVLDIVLFSLGKQDIVKIVSMILFILMSVYILSPIGMKYYDRNN